MYVSRLLRPLLRRANSAGNRTFAQKSVAQDPAAKLPTMNDLPVPCGCWKEAYECNQKKYNKQLKIGLAMLTIAMSYPMATGNIFFNYFPPPFPEIYKEELCKQ